MTMREEFEAYYVAKGSYIYSDRFARPEGERYDTPEVQEAFEIWQAAYSAGVRAAMQGRKDGA